MKAVLMSYKTEGLSKTESSKLSKRLVGYTDRSNKSKYTYERKGLIRKAKGLIISKSTFIIPYNKAEEIREYINSKQGLVSLWNIEIPSRYFKS